MITVKEYAQYLLDNFPPDAPVMKYNYYQAQYHMVSYPHLQERNRIKELNKGFPEGVEQIVVI